MRELGERDGEILMFRDAYYKRESRFKSSVLTTGKYAGFSKTTGSFGIQTTQSRRVDVLIGLAAGCLADKIAM